MALLRLLFPPKCPFCGNMLEAGEDGLCTHCVETLPYTGSHWKSTGSFFRLCASPLLYRDKARQAMLRYKFYGHTAYAECFARLMADCVTRHLPGDFDIITWVPLEVLRYHRRGYSQTRLLAMHLARQLEVPALRLLRKRRRTQAQSGLRGIARRKANISGAFTCRRSGDIPGKRVLLVDDVVTTGATLSECARVLLTAGAREVCCVTLCRAHSGEKQT